LISEEGTSLVYLIENPHFKIKLAGKRQFFKF